MKDIILKAFVASALLDLLDMTDDPAAEDVQAFIKAHPEVESQIMEGLESPGMEESCKEYAREAARTVLTALKDHVGETA